MSIVNESVMQIGSNHSAKNGVGGRDRKNDVDRMDECECGLNNAEQRKKNAPYQIK